MDKLINPGRVISATGFIALGVICIIAKDFIVGRPSPWPEGFNVNPGLAYLSGAILVVAAGAILLKRRAGPAALVIAALIFLLSVLRTLPSFIDALPYGWLNGFKCLAFMGGALIVAGSFYYEQPLRKRLILTGTVLLALFFIACGYAHFKFADFTRDFIPDYIPFHTFWAYFCGICLLAGGIGLLLPQTRRLAALLSGIMVLGWFLLLHIPRFLANPNDASDRMGLCESFTIGGIFLLLAGLLSKKD